MSNDHTEPDTTMTEPRGLTLARPATPGGVMVGGTYRVDGRLTDGDSEMVVYTATDRSGRRVAVKMLRPELTSREDLRDRLLREHYVARRVDHPGLATVVDAGAPEDGAPFLVMELLDGQSIASLWQHNGRALPPKAVLAIGHSLCEVLAAVHAAGVVHGSLRPENLFVTRDGRLKVLGFGGARLGSDDAPRLIESDTPLGTPSYLAPEQARGDMDTVDARTDLWAVGAVMFALLSGRPVHDGVTLPSRMALTSPAPSLATVAPHVAPALVALVDRALAFEKGARWTTALEMRDAIADVSLALHGQAAPSLAIDSATLLAAMPLTATASDAITIGLDDDATRLRATPGGEPALGLPAPPARALPSDTRRPLHIALDDPSGATRIQPLHMPSARPPAPSPSVRSPAVAPNGPPAPPAAAARARPSGVTVATLIVGIVGLGFFVYSETGSAPSPAAPVANAASVVKPAITAPPVATPEPTPPPVPHAPPVLAKEAPPSEPTAAVARPRPVPRAPSKPAPAPPRKLDCTQKFFIVDGKKVWRPECIE